MVLTAILLGVGIGIMQSVPLDWKYAAAAMLSGLSWVLAAWSLKEGLNGIEWLTVTLPSVLFTAAVGLFYVLLPQSWLARAIIIALFGIGQYALLLTANIFSVAAIRTIALFRAATAVGFALTLLTGFLLFNTILSFRLDFWLVGLCVFASSLALLLPGLWSVKLEPRLSREVATYSFWLSFMLGWLAMATSFWPISLSVESLFLCTMLYIFLGVTQHEFSQRLFKKTVWEYVTVGAVVITTMLLTAGRGV